MRGVHRVAYWKSISIYAASIDTSLAYPKLFFLVTKLLYNWCRFLTSFLYIFQSLGLPGMKYEAFNVLVEMLFFRSYLRRLILLINDITNKSFQQNPQGKMDILKFNCKRDIQNELKKEINKPLSEAQKLLLPKKNGKTFCVA